MAGVGSGGIERWLLSLPSRRSAHQEFSAGLDYSLRGRRRPRTEVSDLRRTAVRNMRRAGVPQVVRTKITVHRPDSMERRYNIVDIDDIKSAREMVQKRQKDKD